MNLKNMMTRFALVIIFFAGVLANAPSGIAEGAPHPSDAVQRTDLSISPFKGQPTARVVITVFSDFQ
jgi:protein-disulfide isomerase